MKKSRQVVNAIVEDILRPNIDDPRLNRRQNGGEFIYSDWPSTGDKPPRIGVETVDVNPIERARIGSAESVNEARIRVIVQMNLDPSGEAFRENFEWPDSEDIRKAEDLQAYLESEVQRLIVDDVDVDDPSNSAIRSIDPEIVVAYAGTATRYPSQTTRRRLVDFLATYTGE